MHVLLRIPFVSNHINQKAIEGNTPLHLLVALQFDCATLIRHPVADKKAVNKENLSALDIVLATIDNVKIHESRVTTKFNLSHSH